MTESVGDQLQQARLSHGLSIEQAAQATHIRIHYLEALETDQKSHLPSKVQGKGFLRLYADYLGLDKESLVALWEGKSVAPKLVSTQPQPDTQSDPVPVQVDTSLQSDSMPTDDQPEITNQAAPASAGSQEIFEDIGNSLRIQRESLGLSISEIERYTRLRQHYIVAIENGQLDRLPSPVQARGMISIYATFLNLDEDAVLLRFAEGLQERRLERIPQEVSASLFTPKKKPARQAPFWRRFLTPDLVFGIGLALIILFFIVWTAARIDSLKEKNSEPTPPAIAEVLLNMGTDEATQFFTPAPDLVTAEAIEPGPEMSDFQTTIASPENFTIQTNTSSDLSSTLQSTSDNPDGIVTPTLLTKNDDPLQVYIVAQQRSWLRVVADGKVAFLGRVVPGNAYAFSGANQIDLLTGNAAGLQVFYNQMDLGILGVVGEVLGMTFSAEGVVKSTPIVPPTATPEAIPTITSLPSPTHQATPTVTPFIP